VTKQEEQIINYIIYNLVNFEPKDDFEIDRYDEWRDLQDEYS